MLSVGNLKNLIPINLIMPYGVEELRQATKGMEGITTETLYQCALNVLDQDNDKINKIKDYILTKNYNPTAKITTENINEILKEPSPYSREELLGALVCLKSPFAQNGCPNFAELILQNKKYFRDEISIDTVHNGLYKILEELNSVSLNTFRTRNLEISAIMQEVEDELTTKRVKDAISKYPNKTIIIGASGYLHGDSMLKAFMREGDTNKQIKVLLPNK